LFNNTKDIIKSIFGDIEASLELSQNKNYYIACNGERRNTLKLLSIITCVFRQVLNIS